MKLKRAFLNIGLITLLYVALLVWFDTRSDVFSHIVEVLHQLPVLLAFAFCSWTVRYARWSWLLSKANMSYPFKLGFLAYLSGFAFTASPGKVGELVRIRYFVPMGVSHDKVISAFVFERLSDLIAVLLLSLLIATQFDVFWIAASFVGFIFFALMVLVFNPSILRRVYFALRFTKWKRLLRVVRYLVLGINGIRIWLKPSVFLISIGFGLVAWVLLAASFMWLLDVWKLPIEPLVALAIYPLAMLVGAASMIPGGLGSTEASIVAILYSFEVSIEQATVIALTIRIATLWSAILFGMMALLYLERLMFRDKK